MRFPANHCQWHTTGKPLWWTGDFFVPGCRTCEEKAEKNPGLRLAPTSEQAFERYKAEKRTSGKEAGERMRKARAAKALEDASTIPAMRIERL